MRVAEELEMRREELELREVEAVREMKVGEVIEN